MPDNVKSLRYFTDEETEAHVREVESHIGNSRAATETPAPSSLVPPQCMGSNSPPGRSAPPLRSVSELRVQAWE